jgi:toxin ParE1/3/4
VASAARSELREACRWYDRQQAGLGGALLDEIRQTFDRLRATPDGFPRWVPDRPYRKLGLRRFPYVVLYLVTERELRVLAIAHARRQPGYWLSRR